MRGAGSFRQSVPAVRALCEELSPDIVFVDASYLLIPQKKRAGSSGRRESVSDVVEELKALAIDINRPIIQSVQFNRQAEKPTKQVRTHDSRGEGRSDNSTNNESAGNRINAMNEEHTNNVLHLSLAKIGETDVVGQASSIVLGLDKYAYAPFEDSRRYLAVLKGREGESGVFVVNYNFSPVNFDEVPIPLLIEEYLSRRSMRRAACMNQTEQNINALNAAL